MLSGDSCSCGASTVFAGMGLADGRAQKDGLLWLPRRCGAPVYVEASQLEAVRRVCREAVKTPDSWCRYPVATSPKVVLAEAHSAEYSLTVALLGTEVAALKLVRDSGVTQASGIRHAVAKDAGAFGVEAETRAQAVLALRMLTAGERERKVLARFALSLLNQVP